jgi:predicted metal-dependent HD superfamily phosphohydrolase
MEEKVYLYWDKALANWKQISTSSNSYFKSVISNYKDADRHYHSINHIGSMLDQLSLFSLSKDDEAILILAIIFHDAIYNPIGKNNEVKSAELATQTIQEIGLPTKIIMEVSRLILLTEKHDSEKGDELGNIMLDLDLSIFSTSSALYKAYTKSIRNEYFMYPDFIYRSGRKKVVKSFLQREYIFKTNEFSKWEKTARKNLKNEVL